jgi:hypothetical protein
MMSLKALLLGIAISVFPAMSLAQTSTSFTYQGVLKESGAAANGSFDMGFSLWNAMSGGAQVGATVNAPAQGVVAGLFSIELDFGATAFGDSQFWLEIVVDGSTLTPRLPITGSPFSVQTRGIFVDAAGNIGIGTTTPVDDLHIWGDAATLRIQDDDDPASYTLLEDNSPDRFLLLKRRSFGQSLIDIDPDPADGVSRSWVRFFRGVNTTGLKQALFYRGDNTLAVSASIGVDGTNSWFQAHGGNLGIGTASPTRPLHVEGNALGGTIFGNNSSSSGGRGVQGRAESITGRGVYGEATATTGANSGVYGTSASTSGTGVYGEATTTTGTNSGVHGTSASPSGTGVYGEATATTGSAAGVYGTATSRDGFGVSGFVYDGVGVIGRSTLFRGVTGESESGIGVNGSSSTSVGVRGGAWASTGLNYGVYGLTQSPSGYGVWSDGDFGSSGVKSFVQPHPNDPSKEIRFVCLEGNESGTYFRGSTQLDGGRAYIEVPEEFSFVSETDGLTVQLTARGPNAGLWIESSDLNQIVVVGNGDVQFDYFVNGVRRGFADHESFRENNAYVPEVRGIPFGTQFRPGHRQILVDNGILNPDFTPNERTAARMGWKLRDPRPEERHPAAPAPLAHK